MINIDYKITFQDDLDANETICEYIFNRPWFKWLMIRGITLFFILTGLYFIFFDTVEFAILSAKWELAIGLFFILFGATFAWLMRPEMAQSFLTRREMKRKWSKKNNLEEFRKIALTETEFIFNTKHSKTVWTKKAVNRLFEGSKGFMLWFHSGHQRYIPKRIFDKDRELEQFTAFFK